MPKGTTAVKKLHKAKHRNCKHTQKNPTKQLRLPSREGQRRLIKTKHSMSLEQSQYIIMVRLYPQPELLLNCSLKIINRLSSSAVFLMRQPEASGLMNNGYNNMELAAARRRIAQSVCCYHLHTYSTRQNSKTHHSHRINMTQPSMPPAKLLKTCSVKRLVYCMTCKCLRPQAPIVKS